MLLMFIRAGLWAQERRGGRECAQRCVNSGVGYVTAYNINVRKVSTLGSWPG